MKPELVKGRYRHYKGQDYQVIDLVRHSENEQWLVMYRPLYGEQQLWVRPYDMFIESVEINGRSQPRFDLISADNDSV